LTGYLPHLARPGAAPFWLAVLLTGIGTGVVAAALTRLLEVVQHIMWSGPGTNLLDAAEHAGAWRHILVLLGAGVVTGAGQIVLRQLSSGNGIDTTAAIWFHAGRMPAWRTLGSALLSVVIVGMGVSLGREGAPKQAGAVIANFFSDRAYACPTNNAGFWWPAAREPGWAAAYGVPLGGALFSLEVMRGMLALRYVLPALFSSVVATAVSWAALPDAPTYLIPAYRQLHFECGVGTGGRADRGCGLRSAMFGPSPGPIAVNRRAGAGSQHRCWDWDCLARSRSRSRSCLATARTSRNLRSRPGKRRLCF
jgi:CIC family chloride channel protein